MGDRKKPKKINYSQTQNSQKWLEINDPQAESKFLNLIAQISAQDKTGRGDERGIYSINRALERNEGCFRQNSTLATIVVSDENEASDGNGSFEAPLYDLDDPDVLLAKISTLFLKSCLVIHITPL